MGQQQGFNPTFENGGFWEYYRDLERQFENYLDYVPYLKGNENTYSFRLANIILAIGAHIDSAFKEIAKYTVRFGKYPEILNQKTKRGKHRKPTMKDYYPISEEYNLTEEFVTFKCLPDRENVTPFEQYNRKSEENYPYWWTDYNKIKHNFSDSFKKATLQTVRDALAGAFLLNVIHEPAADRFRRYKLLIPKYAPRGYQQIYDKFRGRSIQPVFVSDLSSVDPYRIETPLFIYDYEKVIIP